MRIFRQAFALIFLAFPPVFLHYPSGNDYNQPVLYDSAYISVVHTFTQMGVPVNYNSNPLLYTELQNWLGTPHIKRSRGLAGIDCSGLVKAVFKNVYGIELTGSSQDMARMVRTVELTALREGDLVFFRIYHPSRIDHIGIFLGNGKFVHTSSSNGVIVSDLSSAYYRRRFVKAGRIPEEKLNMALMTKDK